jgi:hypothetical protein
MNLKSTKKKNLRERMKTPLDECFIFIFYFKGKNILILYSKSKRYKYL